ncbi:uncharacterized protein VTP21DRAFT_4023 [Calcarisporiella thermophila]|uniref:uncharacterized protein n=1 Tax=Calcarisporiella thermophila TaxID=911321 RepID=UPI003744069F
MPPNAPCSSSVSNASCHSQATQDVRTLKLQLANALGDNAAAYWGSVADFVHGKLNRAELDFYANMYLSRENAHLHSKFILANLHSISGSSAKGTAASSTGTASRSRKKNRSAKVDNAAVTKSDLSHHQSESKLASNSTGTCARAKFLPSLQTCKERMVSIALENGLYGGVSDETVTLMNHALEWYLKNLINDCINYCKPIMVCENNQLTAHNAGRGLTSKDIAFALELSRNMGAEKAAEKAIVSSEEELGVRKLRKKRKKANLQTGILFTTSD